MHPGLCICPLMPTPRLETRTRVLLVIHRIEDHKSTNTGRLATECLANSEVVVRGMPGEPVRSFTWRDDTTPVILFPHEDAVSIEGFVASPRPVTLVVPDGTWRQASKMRHRVPGLSGLPAVSIPFPDRSNYQLRSAPHAGELATLESIARALGVLESRAVQHTLEYLLRAMVERTLWSRGMRDATDVASGIPASAVRHDPSSGRAGGTAD